MIERVSRGIMSDQGSLGYLKVKYRLLEELVCEREEWMARGTFSLEGSADVRRKILQRRLASQFPGSLAELDYLRAQSVSGLLKELRSLKPEKLPATLDAAVGIRFVADYHLEIWRSLERVRTSRAMGDHAPSSDASTKGLSQRVGCWVREKYGLEANSQVWKFGIAWVRGAR